MSQQQQHQHQHPQQQQMHMQGIQQGMNPGRGPGAVGASPLYPPPAFQNHFKQLGKLTRFLIPSPSPSIELCRPRFIP
jgi:hypothetical protein